ncbi:MAG: hypothetical protein ACQESG_02810 [Nanobdellota archaeon]
MADMKQIVYLVLLVLCIILLYQLFVKPTGSTANNITALIKDSQKSMEMGKEYYAEGEYRDALDEFEAVRQYTGLRAEADLYEVLCDQAIGRDVEIKALEERMSSEVIANLKAEEGEWTCCDFQDFGCIWTRHCNTPCTGPCNHHSH